MHCRRTFCVSIAVQLAAQTAEWTDAVVLLMDRGVAEAKLPGAVALVEDDGETLLLESRAWLDLTR